jgi:endonuclease-8
MPEGPEIRRAADRIQAAIGGQRVEVLYFAFESLRPWSERLQGETVAAVDTIGKHMLIRFENGVRIYSHNQLYGRWYVRDRDRYPETRRSLRLALHTARRSALLYSASAVDVIREAQLGKDRRLAGLGLDPLHRESDLAQVKARFGDSRFRGRALAGLLLDQKFFAGLGNYLRSEILFDAGVHPARRPADCDRRQLERLARAVLYLTRRSYRTGGVTNDPDRVRQLREQGLPRAALRFQVFGRAGQPCYRCGSKIQRLSLAGRRLYICPACQPGGDV